MGGEKALKLLQHKDEIKNSFCNKNGINLLRISYKDIENIHRILTKHLLKNKPIFNWLLIAAAVAFKLVAVTKPATVKLASVPRLVILMLAVRLPVERLVVFWWELYLLPINLILVMLVHSVI